jgi:uncharacterized protein
VRIVLDTTNLVSSLIQSLGPSAAIVDAWRQGQLTLISSAEQLNELREVLSRPRIQRRVTPEQAARLVENIPAAAEIVEPAKAVRLSADPKDDYIIGMAITGRADRIVTGDKHHLLSLGKAAGIQIVTARELVTLLEQQKQQRHGHDGLGGGREENR